MSGAPLISIIDDDELVRDGIRELVESLGYKTSTFESAEDFLKSSMVADTACLITDVQMPGLSGLELQETLLSRGYQTPVILITGYPNPAKRAKPNFGEAKIWHEWLTTKPGLDAILSYRIDGQEPFFPPHAEA